MVGNNNQINFPFSAVIGQDDFKLALILNLVDPLIGGVLAIGDKGTGKTTLIRSVTNLMNDKENIPFINLPIGVSEDRLIGSIDLEQLINSKKEVVTLGLMAQAHRGILYVDEVNLLHDYLTDILLDAAATGTYYLEREGISRYFDSQFCLVGSMNPEEGQLRPQLKDRFGLSVSISTSHDTKIRQQIIKQRINFDDNPLEFSAKYKREDLEIRQQIEHAKAKLTSIVIEDSIIAYCSDLAIKNNVEGLRADILLLKTARAYAAFQNLAVISTDTVDKIANFVLNHRRLETPPNQESQQQPQDNLTQDKPLTAVAPKDENTQILIPENEFIKLKNNSTASINTDINSSKRATGTYYATDAKKTVSQYLATDKFELKTKGQQHLLKQHHIFIIDTSGSMLKDQIIAYAKGAVNKIAGQSKNQSTQFSMIALFDGTAQHILHKTGILKDIDAALLDLKVGGKTNLIAGFKLVKGICVAMEFSHHLHIITDGKLTTTHDLEQVVLAFQSYCKGIQNTQIIDVEQGMIKIGVAAELAHQIQANYELLTTTNEY
jgi:magnesium chelatase subunit D